ncbi:Transposable element P transposase [Frankliniella fusca]|uniref:Transposable element P transposase n=1 Tax=Frankliniella fusca TaxID=407009 RepID=A0AAE1GV92_9NEOP|nr:Transposable element P transposase [Frankliniella fusca]
MHFNMGGKDFVHSTISFPPGERRIMYFMLDPPHLLKTFPNCFANSFSHRKSRQLYKSGQNLSWKAIEALFELTKNDKYKCTKLTKAHVSLTSFSCMNVKLAAQVFSKSVAKALRERKNDSPLREVYSDELVLFIDLMNNCFDCFNGGEESEKKKENPYLLEYTSKNDLRFAFLEKDFISYLEDWEKDVQEREGRFTKEQRGKMMISHQSIEGMKISILSFGSLCRFLLNKGAPSVSSRQFNQDPLEQWFSDFRRAGGSSNNLTLKQVLHSRFSLQAQDQMFS